MGSSNPVVLVDTNVIIEAVRTRCWNALAGGLALETVATCSEEAQRGNHSRPGYVRVTSDDLGRLRAVHDVTQIERAMVSLAYADAPGMDAGERDLFAHAFARVARGDKVWVLCSPDKASIRAGIALHWEDQLCSLGFLAESVGARFHTPLAAHFHEAWLSRYRTQYLLER